MQVPQLTQIPLQRFTFVPKFQPAAQNNQKPNNVSFQGGGYKQNFQPTQNVEFDGKRLRKAVTRKTVDYNSSVIKYLEARVWQRDYRDRRVVQPDPAYYTEMTPTLSMPDNPINAVTTKFVRTSTNKMRCPIFCVAWTPEGRRLVTGASSGEFTLWNGLTFNFETILQAHDSPVRCMVWSHNDLWMVTGDHAGYVKYWQSNMNNVKMFQAHKEPVREISFCPADNKFVTCSDDGTVRIWDFFRFFEEKILRGHGADVKCVDWHPQKSLLVSGSKDSQQPIKLWDPKTGQSLATIHAHKNTVMDAKWNKNGNWLLTASRDHLIKLFDIRNMSQEMQTFRGHKKEATTLAWHPIHEGLFTSGGSDGCVMFWNVGADKEVGCMEQAHDSCVWSLAWHPLGHILCSGSNDHSSKFWTRNRPGDKMRDKYNLNTLPKGSEEYADYDDTGTVSAIPGMGLEHGVADLLKPPDKPFEDEIPIIPGLDFGPEEPAAEKSTTQKKIPFSKPIPKQFQQQWMESKQPLLLAPPIDDRSNGDMSIPPEVNSQPALMPPPAPPQVHFPQNPSGGGPVHFPQNPSGGGQFQDQVHFPQNQSGGGQFQEQVHFPQNQSGGGQFPEQVHFPQNQGGSGQFQDQPHFPQNNSGGGQFQDQVHFPQNPSGGGQFQDQPGHHLNVHERPLEPPPLPPPPMPEGFMLNRPPADKAFPENRENFPHEHSRNEPPHHDSWRPYSEHPMDTEENRGPPEEGRGPENGAQQFLPPQDMRHSFDPSQNHSGPPPGHGRPERFPPPSHPMEEDYMPENPSRMGPPPPFHGERFPGPQDGPPRNSHLGPSGRENFTSPRKRPWGEEPMREEAFPQQMREFDGPPDFNRHPVRQDAPRFLRGRGPRAPFRGGRTPYRIINRGRGRGGYPN